MSDSLTLRDSEDFLRTMFDTDEAVPDEQREEYERALVVANLAAVDKRDAVGYALAKLERQLVIKGKHPDTGKSIDLPGEIDMEIERLKERKQFVQRSLDRFRTYVLDVIFTQPRDRKGELAKLEGRTSTLSAAKCPESLAEEIDMAALPDRFKRVTLQMPLEMWAAIIDHCGAFATAVRETAKVKETEPTRAAIKEAIQAKVEVPGAKMAPVKYRLARK